MTAHPFAQLACPSGEYPAPAKGRAAVRRCGTLPTDTRAGQVQIDHQQEWSGVRQQSRSCLLPSALSHLPSAFCPLPSALCPQASGCGCQGADGAAKPLSRGSLALIQPSSSPHAALIQPACRPHPVRMQPSCSPHAALMQPATDNNSEARVRYSVIKLIYFVSDCIDRLLISMPS